MPVCVFGSLLFAIVLGSMSLSYALVSVSVCLLLCATVPLCVFVLWLSLVCSLDVVSSSGLVSNSSLLLTLGLVLSWELGF